MIKIKAKIKLFDGSNCRKTPFASGYRPLFNFIDSTKTSGQIELIDRQYLKPGDEGIVYILFINDNYLGKDFDIGKNFSFDEGNYTLGEGEVIEILNK